MKFANWNLYSFNKKISLLYCWTIDSKTENKLSGLHATSGK